MVIELTQWRAELAGIGGTDDDNFREFSRIPPFMLILRDRNIRFNADCRVVKLHAGLLTAEKFFSTPDYKFTTLLYSISDNVSQVIQCRLLIS